MEIYRDPNNIIEVSAGQFFGIALKANLTAGFAWILEIYDDTIVKIIEKKSTQPSDTKPVNSIKVGEETEQIFEIEAIKPGKLEIKMKYKREWKKSSKDEKTFMIIVNPKFF